MNPNIRELGEIIFQPDGVIDFHIENCLNCVYFQSYREYYKSKYEPCEFGYCRFPFMMIDETYGLGMVCDFYRQS